MSTVSIVINVPSRDYRAASDLLDKEQTTVKRFLREALLNKIEGKSLPDNGREG